MKCPPILALLILILGILQSCVPVKKTLETPDRYRNRCDLMEKGFSIHDTLTKTQFIQQKLIINRYSETSILACNAVGLIPDLLELEQLRENYTKDSSQENYHNFESKKVSILLSLSVKQGEIESLSQLVECEQDRTDDLKYYLNEQANKMQK